MNNATPTKEVYTVKEVAEILDVSLRGAYNFVNATKDFKVLRIGKSLRINKTSFDEWLRGGVASC